MVDFDIDKRAAALLTGQLPFMYYHLVTVVNGSQSSRT